MIKLLSYAILLLIEEIVNMEKPLHMIESDVSTLTESEPDGKEGLSKRRDAAFNVALGKLLDSNGNIETVLQTGEAFGRGLFTEIISENSKEWTMKEWLDSTMENIFEPMGNVFKINKIADDEVESFLTRCPLHQDTDEPYVASLFTYAFIRGMLKSAFPNGELLMGDTMAEGAPMTEFVFKTNASYRDRFERERVKNYFTIE